MKNLIFFVFVLLQIASASADEIGSFRTSTGKVVTFVISAYPKHCTSGLANNMSIITNGIKINAILCSDDSARPSHLLGTSTNQDGFLNPGFYLYMGAEFNALMEQINAFGNPSGRIGNAINGKCSDDSNAFISLRGSLIGDPGYGGYCFKIIARPR